MKDVDSHAPEFHENLVSIQKHLALIDIIIDRIFRNQPGKTLNTF